MPKLVDYNWY